MRQGFEGMAIFWPWSSCARAHSTMSCVLDGHQRRLLGATNDEYKLISSAWEKPRILLSSSNKVLAHTLDWSKTIDAARTLPEFEALPGFKPAVFATFGRTASVSTKYYSEYLLNRSYSNLGFVGLGLFK